MFPWIAHRKARGCSLGLLVSLCAGAGACSGPADTGREPADDHHEQAAELVVLQASVEQVDLGIVTHGHTRLETIRLTNTTDETVESARIESSCECLVAVYSDLTVPPGQSLLLTVDFLADPYERFVGGLRMTLTAYDWNDRPLFELPVRAEVLPTDMRVPLGESASLISGAP